MKKVYHAACFAVICQLLAATALIGAILLFVCLRPPEASRLPSQSEVSCLLLAPSSVIFPMAIALLAVGVILTSHPYLDITAASIRTASRLINRANPREVMQTLRANLWLGSLAFAMLAFKPPMDIISRIFGGETGACPGAIVWPVLMSLGLAGAGATAHAVEKSLKL